MSLKLVAAAAALASVFALTACDDKGSTAKKAEEPKAAAETKTAANEPLKVGFVYVAPIADVGYTKQHDIGRLYAIDKVGKDKITTTFVENVPETADAERVIRQMINDGNKLIFGTSFGYMNYMQKLAKEYPDVKFEHATGYKSAPNMTNYNIRFYEGRYLAGMLAGGATKSNVIGYVAPFPIPEVLQGINAFTLGAKSVNPKIQVKVVWTNAWYDPPKDTDSAKTLIGQGADVLTQHTNTSAVASAAEAAGKMVIPYNSDMKSVAPNAQIAALVLNWGPYYAKKINQALENKWENKPVWMHLKEGAISLENISDKVPADVVKKMEEVKAKINSGEFHPFTGPIKTNEGKDAVKAGETLPDDKLVTMNYYVDGVVGKVPN
ncbi:BMP family ABC transporter substrate-binding protein [Turicimonas muris]|uniref:BMP family ABC transporter substrate-binding protein n=4 Tax=Turicimonas muris TaxID=1796652 RepID=A0A227KI44_9BURK|nr:BMP family ABC transporter substrate-binding protein [Turicimonas muris]ANU66622.1 BMP family ABC transporter substrate-binding protein [Burkholderiales bacterium YL45]OXE47269.1 BMP family ABC transporter substrate-binding protein [Turicimonas muris]QQQ97770.1 BMP family ABC transporter substrate-binding protein [Turicimonas muris]